MTLEELQERLDELTEQGIHPRTPILAREPAVPGEIIDEMFTIEDVAVGIGGQVRLILQPSFDSEEN